MRKVIWRQKTQLVQRQRGRREYMAGTGIHEDNKSLYSLNTFYAPRTVLVLNMHHLTTPSLLNRDFYNLFFYKKVI